MKEEYYNVVGVMSGTSLDGVDLAHVQFRVRDQKWTFKIIESGTVGYNRDWINTLKSAMDYSETELQKTNREYTKLLSSIISDFIEKNKIDNLGAICSHGHTILHQSEKGLTLQIALALPDQKGRILITGGGTYNDFLIERIESHLPEMEIIIPSAKILEFKEALIFALLGVLKSPGKINVLSRVNGARKDHSSGFIYQTSTA